MTDDGKNLLIQLEDIRCEVYPDSAGLPTIGVGHLLTKDELSSGKIWVGEKCFDYRAGLTEQQAIELMEADVAPRSEAVRALVKAPLPDHRMDALTIFAFNIGLEAFRKSTLLQKVNAGEFNEVPAQLRRWVYAGGKKIAGLVNRREAEIRLWNGEA